NDRAWYFRAHERPRSGTDVAPRIPARRNGRDRRSRVMARRQDDRYGRLIGFGHDARQQLTEFGAGLRNASEDRPGQSTALEQGKGAALRNGVVELARACDRQFIALDSGKPEMEQIGNEQQGLRGLEQR